MAVDINKTYTQASWRGF